MHIAYVSLESNPDFKSFDLYINSPHIPYPLILEIQKSYSATISIIQRAPIKKTITDNLISFYFIKDEFEPTLRWWQEPESTFQLLKDVHPDVIILQSLNLPLQFRWLRRIVGDNKIIIGEHTGEKIWVSRNLWLQQFGLRVVDGFIFNNLKEAHGWTKASVILEKQPITKIDLYSKNTQKIAKSVVEFYDILLSTKDSKSIKK